VLVKEIHYRVKNNLQIVTSLLRMQSAELVSEESKIHFQEAINRVMSMSLIHQKLHQGESLSKINLNKYTKELAQDLVWIFDSGKILNSKLKQMMFRYFWHQLHQLYFLSMNWFPIHINMHLKTVNRELSQLNLMELILIIQTQVNGKKTQVVVLDGSN
jgi:hypothetical protein